MPCCDRDCIRPHFECACELACLKGLATNEAACRSACEVDADIYNTRLFMPTWLEGEDSECLIYQTPCRAGCQSSFDSATATCLEDYLTCVEGCTDSACEDACEATAKTCRDSARATWVGCLAACIPGDQTTESDCITALVEAMRAACDRPLSECLADADIANLPCFMAAQLTRRNCDLECDEDWHDCETAEGVGCSATRGACLGTCSEDLVEDMAACLPGWMTDRGACGRTEFGRVDPVDGKIRFDHGELYYDVVECEGDYARDNVICAVGNSGVPLPSCSILVRSAAMSCRMTACQNHFFWHDHTKAQCLLGCEQAEMAAQATCEGTYETCIDGCSDTECEDGCDDDREFCLASIPARSICETAEGCADLPTSCVDCLKIAQAVTEEEDVVLPDEELPLIWYDSLRTEPRRRRGYAVVV